MPNTIILGLTGSFGTGKTTVAGWFARRGAKVIDADAITRELLTRHKKSIKKVAKAFPHAILNQDRIDRKKLADIVFQNPRELKKLTKILHPEALKEVRKQISLYKHARLIVLDVPLLFESGWDRLAHVTAVVTARRDQQIQRTRKRSGLSKTATLKRLKFQLPLQSKIRLADIIIDNRGPLRNTRRQVDAIIHRLGQRSNT